jgi:ABC-type sugar transport system ATPase subunit
MDKIIEISHLSKSYGDIKAVNDLSFSVYHGELFAFLGVNGAGKSTTISIMCGQIKKDSGKIVICGKDTEKNFNSVSSDIGVVFQNSVLDKALSVKDNQRRIWIYLWRIYARLKLFCRTAKSYFFFAGYIRHGTFTQSRFKRCFQRTVRNGYAEGICHRI